jgi:hypothetical protein
LRAFSFIEAEEQKVAMVNGTTVTEKDFLAVMKLNREVLFQDMAEKMDNVSMFFCPRLRTS